MAGKLLFKNYLKSTIFLERFGGDTNIAIIVLFFYYVFIFFIYFY